MGAEIVLVLSTPLRTETIRSRGQQDPDKLDTYRTVHGEGPGNEPVDERSPIRHNRGGILSRGRRCHETRGRAAANVAPARATREGTSAPLEATVDRHLARVPGRHHPLGRRSAVSGARLPGRGTLGRRPLRRIDLRGWPGQ